LESADRRIKRIGYSIRTPGDGALVGSAGGQSAAAFVLPQRASVCDQEPNQSGSRSRRHQTYERQLSGEVEPAAEEGLRIRRVVDARVRASKLPRVTTADH